MTITEVVIEVAVEHSTNGAYQKGCRCSGCREAHRLYMREYRTRQRSGTYVFRNITNGHPLASDEIADRVGVDFPAVGTVVRALAVMGA